MLPRTRASRLSLDQALHITGGTLPPLVRALQLLLDSLLIPRVVYVECCSIAPALIPSQYTAIRSPGNRASTISVVSNNKVVLIIADKTIAYETWAPRFQPSSGFGHYTPTSNVPGVWILGPHLVRNATLQGNTLAIQGDLNVTSTIDIWGPSSIQKVTWNGKSVSVSNNSKLRSLHGSIQLDVSANSISVPNLSQASWKYLDSIPEADPNYDDSTWTVANKTSTARPQQPYEGKYVLYGEE